MCCRLIDPIEFIRRPGGLGLGAVPAPPELMDNKKKKKKNKIKLPGDEDRKVGVVSASCGCGQCFMWVCSVSGYCNSLYTILPIVLSCGCHGNHSCTFSLRFRCLIGTKTVE